MQEGEGAPGDRPPRGGVGGPRPAPLRIPFRRRARVVAWAKVALPLVALGLLSTVFLLARGPREGAIPFGRIEEIAREQRIEAPRLAGLAPDGTAVELSARRLSPVPGRRDVFVLEAPVLVAEGADGSRARVAAARGEADGTTGRLRLTNGVRATARGAEGAWSLSAPSAEASLETGELRLSGPVRAEAPWGRIEAGALEVVRAPGRLLFTDGVRLLYVPRSRPPPGEAPDPSRPSAP